MELLRSTFAGNKKLAKALRKLFLPSIGDPELPLESMGTDVWLSGINYAQIPDSEIKAVVLARQDAIKFVAGAFIKLGVIANSPAETAQEKSLRMKQDSSQ